MNEKMLRHMLEILSNYKKDKKYLLEKYINDRLTKSLETYYSELSSSLEYLISKDDLRVLKNLNKVD